MYIRNRNRCFLIGIACHAHDHNDGNDDDGDTDCDDGGDDISVVLVYNLIGSVVFGMSGRSKACIMLTNL